MLQMKHKQVPLGESKVLSTKLKEMTGKSKNWFEDNIVRVNTHKF